MKKSTTFLLVVLLIFGVTTNAQWVQIGEDIDGENEGDSFGVSVSMSNNGLVIAVGASRNDNNGEDSGHVKVYENINGIWSQLGNDIVGEYTGDRSGRSISLSSDGSILAIGAFFNDGNGDDSGHVRVYEFINGLWTQIGLDINGEFSEDRFGWSVRLNSDGSIVAVGATRNIVDQEAGHVRVFENINGYWLQIGDDIDGEDIGDGSGHSISINSVGTIVAIGAYWNGGNGYESGHVRIYRNNNGAWVQIGDDIDGEEEGDRSGVSVSLNCDGTTVAIGAIWNDENGNNSGHVRVYKNVNGSWVQVGQDIDGENEGDLFGEKVSLSCDGNILAISAIYNDGNGVEAGHVRVYEYVNDSWTQIGDDIDGENEGDLSGTSLDMSSDGSIIIIGASFNDGNATDSGHVRVFKNEDLGTSDVSESKISIYPNPTSGVVNFEFKNNSIQKVVVIDITGKIIINITEFQQNKSIDISNLVNGIYLIKIQINNEIFVSKIIKE